MNARDRRRLLVALVVPLAAFLVLRRVLGNATGALAITDAIPIVWVVAVGIWRRELAVVAVVSAVVFAIALGLTITFGGSALPLELRRSVFPGLVGIACLVSVAIGRPLLAVAAARVPGRDASRLQAPQARRILRTLTAIIGVALVTDAAAQVVLALTVSTATFAVVARVAGYAIIGGGLAACAVYLRIVWGGDPNHS